VVVKDKVGRRRYIVALRTENIKEAFREIKNVDEWAKIISVNDKYVLVRCRHWYKDEVISILLQHGVETKITTGTIKKAKKIINSLPH